MSGLRRSIDRLFAHLINDKRTSPAFSWRWLNRVSERLFWENPGATIRPQYAWGIVFAAALGRALKRSAVSVIEFGVAGGKGLVAMQAIAEQVSREFNIRIVVFGFDTGKGLPPISDPRDLPQLYRPGDFQMDQSALREQLKPDTSLILGNIRSTIDQFLSSSCPPVGFVSFDMDLYTATRDSLKLFRGEYGRLNCLPRVVCYFDDIMGTTQSDCNGERLAMSEFNQEHAQVRGISPVYGLRYHLGWPHSRAQWPDMMFWAQFLDHPDYCHFDGLAMSDSLPL